MDTVRLAEIWDGCSLLEHCDLPYEYCFKCAKTNAHKKPYDPIKREVKDYGYDERKPCDS